MSETLQPCGKDPVWPPEKMQGARGPSWLILALLGSFSASRQKAITSLLSPKGTWLLRAFQALGVGVIIVITSVSCVLLYAKHHAKYRTSLLSTGLSVGQEQAASVQGDPGLKRGSSFFIRSYAAKKNWNQDMSPRQSLPSKSRVPVRHAYVHLFTGVICIALHLLSVLPWHW